MKITLVPNTGAKDTIPYITHIEIVEATVNFETAFDVPVYASTTNGKTIYDVEVCGFRMETENIAALPKMTGKLLAGLVNMARLPSYVFIARQAREVYPVYTVEHEVFATTPGGPVFRHVELAKVREYLTDYLHAVGILGTPGKNDKLHVRGVNAKTLALMRPVFYLKKRIPGQTEFWAPVFESRDGKRIYAYAASARREVVIQDGAEIFELRALVAQALMNDKRLGNTYDLRPDRLLPEYWQRLKTTLVSMPPVSMLEPLDIEMYRRGGLYVAVETRYDEERYNLFVDTNTSLVTARVRQDFARRDIIESMAVPAG